MKRIKDCIFLHLVIMLFSFTGVFSKLASNVMNENGLHDIRLYVYLGLMMANCFIYAIVWQKMIKKFDLSFAFANRSVYLIWSQVWAVIIFKESLSFKNIIGVLIVLTGVLIVQVANAKDAKEEGQV